MVAGLQKYFVYSILRAAVVPVDAFANGTLGRSLAPDRHGLYLDHMTVGEKVAARWIENDSRMWRFVGTWRAPSFYQGTYDLYLYYPKLGGPNFDRNPRIVIKEDYHERVRSLSPGAGTAGRMVEIELSERQYDCLDPSVVRYYFQVEIDNSIVTYRYDFTAWEERFYSDSFVPGMTGFLKETGSWYQPDSEHQALWEMVCDLDNYDIGRRSSRRIQ